MESITKVLAVADEANARKKENEIAWFKTMMGEKCLFDINQHVGNALRDPNNIQSINDGIYLLKVDIQELNITNVRKQFDERLYFQSNRNYVNGIPVEIIKECIQLPDDLSIIKVGTQGMSDMYYDTFADTCCEKNGFIVNLMCCCLPFLCCTRCSTKSLKSGHIDMTLFLWFKKKEVVIGMPITYRMI